METKFKRGDRVAEIHYGWGTVVVVHDIPDYKDDQRVVVEFDSAERTRYEYCLDGRDQETDLLPCLMTMEEALKAGAKKSEKDLMRVCLNAKLFLNIIGDACVALHSLIPLNNQSLSGLIENLANLNEQKVKITIEEIV